MYNLLFLKLTQVFSDKSLAIKVRRLLKLRFCCTNSIKISLVNLALVGAVGVPTCAHADTATMLARMERDMRAMRQQVQELKQKQALENRRVRAQLERQRIVLEANPYSLRDSLLQRDDLSELAGIDTSSDQLLSGSSGGNQPTNGILGTNLSKLAKPHVGDTANAILTSTPSVHPDLYGPLHRGQIQIGDARLTLGGFLEAAGIWRSRNMGSDNLTSSLPGVPMPNSPYHNIAEFHESSRASRLSSLLEGMITKKLEADAYIEVDFDASAASSNGRGTNAYSLRMRNAYGELKDFKHGWYLLAGQNWSMLTLSHNGMFARDEEVLITIDQANVAGFNYTRAPQLRIFKMFKDNLFGVGLSIESPSAVLQGSACTGRSCASVVTNRKGAGINNPLTYYATDIAPDVIGKITADPQWGHVEISGVMRFFHDRSIGGAPHAHNHTSIAGGIGGGFEIPLFHNKAHIRASGLVGEGIGRYGASELTDYTYGANGKPQPLPEASFVFGGHWHPHPSIIFFAYAGMDTVLSRKYSNNNGNFYGYGNPNYNMSGCQIPGTAVSTCQAGSNIHWVREATGGLWYTALKTDFGSILTGAQYAHVQVDGYSGKGGHGHTDADMFLFSVRGLLFG